MDKLDRESKKTDAIFEKGFIKYTGIIKKPTRCFSLKDKTSINESTMLKIKDSVDLKTLERYGFIYKQEQKNQYEHYAYISKTENDFYPVLRCYVYCQDRRIGVNTNNIDILFDLIQSGLVEKVEGK